MTRLIAILAGVATLLLLGLTYFVTIGRTTPIDQCFGASVAGGAIGGPFTLVDGDGQTVTDADVITEPTLVYFGYTFCPDVCPIDNARNAQAVEILEEQGISATPVFITIDPERDTPEVMRDYVENFSPKMVGLTGSAEQIKAVAGEYRVVYSKADDEDPDYYLMNHSVFTYLMMPQTGFATFFRREDTPQQVADQVSCAVEGP